MSKLTVQQKAEVSARVSSFPSSGLKYKVKSNICRYVGSLVGRDFKSIGQMAPFVLMPYVHEVEKPVWLALSKVQAFIYMLKIFRIAYCTPFKLSDLPQYQEVCESFVSAVKLGFPELLNKPKVHLLLHLPQSMRDFGPTSAYNTER